MNCSCITGSGSYRFSFEPLDCKTFLYQDLSDWIEEEHYVVPETYEVEISVPGRKFSAKITVNTEGVNKLTSSELVSQDGLCLPDGVYCFTFINCGGETYKRHVGISCRLDCCVDQAVAKATRNTDWERIVEIRNWIHSFHSNAELGRINAARDAYRVADKLLKKLECGCNNSACCS